ncbi:MAG: glycosyl hydrolase, partial [Burkholderiaceae bacterium]|nr:glycosyl hydrolase [Burkholderiaceae bacterium]
MPSKLQAVTWAFATGSCGSENWNGVSASSFASANVQSFVSAGKKYMVSTGGAGANFTCSSDTSFAKFIKTYYSANMLGVDFDIENTQSQTDVDNLVQRVVNAQAAYPHLRYSFTVATDGGNEAQSLGSYGVMVMNAIKKYGLKNYTINLMVMDFANSGQENSALCTLGTNGLCEMGQSSISAAKSLHNYWGVPYGQIELTPMIGGNDNIDETFTIADAKTVSAFVLANKLGGVHFWSFERDRDCAP